MPLGGGTSFPPRPAPLAYGVEDGVGEMHTGGSDTSAGSAGAGLEFKDGET